MMRAIFNSAVATVALIPTMLRAQASASGVAAAPVVPVTTTAVPAGAAQLAPIMPTPNVGQPSGGWELQQQFTPIGVEARRMASGILDPLMLFVCVVVFALLIYVLFRYRAARNPVASRTSHNTVVEVIWTVVPVLILVWIAVPSFRLLANQYTPPKADLTIKATGHQWYWEYEYPDQGGFSFDSIMLSDADATKKGGPAKLEVDNRVVVPVGSTVRVLTTATDVIHAFAIPSFWVQMDAVPGRINETWFKVDRPGVYYGQCFQLCGTRHAFMPIAVEVVSKERFAQWVAAKQSENGIAPTTATATPASSTAAAALAPVTPAAGSAAAEAATTPAAPTIPTTETATPVAPAATK